MRRAWAAGLCLGLAAAAGAAAQTVLDFRELLDFERPESWAMAYFGSVTHLTAMGVPEALEPGSLELAFEAGWVPSLSAEERTVGFYGTKEEELNRTSVFGRPRVTVGLPAQLSLTLAWVPPVSIDGVEPNLVALALARPLAAGRRYRLGLRLYGEGGTLQGDITCDRESAAAGADPVRNPFGCNAPSADEVRVRAAGVEAAVAFALGRVEGLEPYAAVAYNYFDNEFRVDARYRTIVDRTVLATNGTTVALTAGLRYALTPRLRLSGELFYTPLDVVRRIGAPRTSGDLLNLRAMIGWRVR